MLQIIRARIGYLNFGNVHHEVEKTIDTTVKPDLLRHFTRGTGLWKHKQIAGEGISLYVAYPIWHWPDMGTRPHAIKPKMAVLKEKREIKPEDSGGEDPLPGD